MKLVVFIKQVPDNTKLQFKDDGPVAGSAPMMMNPYDEYALETAIRLKEAAGGDSTLCVVSLGAQSLPATIGARSPSCRHDAQFGSAARYAVGTDYGSRSGGIAR